MCVVSYCIVVAFHPDLNFPRLYIYRSYDQTQQQLVSLHTLKLFKITFLQTNSATTRPLINSYKMLLLLFKTEKKNTALSEMFSVELKFTVDCLKSWFNRNHKVLEVKRKKVKS